MWQVSRSIRLQTQTHEHGNSPGSRLLVIDDLYFKDTKEITGSWFFCFRIFCDYKKGKKCTGIPLDLAQEMLSDLKEKEIIFQYKNPNCYSFSFRTLLSFEYNMGLQWWWPQVWLRKSCQSRALICVCKRQTVYRSMGKLKGRQIICLSRICIQPQRSGVCPSFRI